MSPSNPRWLDLVRHRVRGIRVPFLLVVQHHAIPATTRLVAPVSSSRPADNDVIAPRLQLDGKDYRIRLLDMAAVPVSQLGETVASLTTDRDAILNAIDVILLGYPAGRPG